MSMNEKIYLAFAIAAVIVVGALLVNPANAQNFIRCQNIVTGDIATFDRARCPSSWIWAG